MRRLIIPPTTSVLLTLMGGFAILITIGTLSLLLPLSHAPESSVSFKVALFTATSAACVTGLTLVNTSATWSIFGEATILALMFLGGLGIMTSGALILLAIGRRLTLSSRLVLQEPLGATSLNTVSSLGIKVFIFASVIQTIGATFLFFQFLNDFSPKVAAWQAIFHSVSAFNNAGFFIVPGQNSLSEFQHDISVLAVISLLIILGSISFIVLADLAKTKRFNRLRLDTRLVIIGSVGLWLVGGLITFLFEHGNPSTLGNLPLLDQITNSIFQSISGRTAGFSSIDFGMVYAPTDFFYLLMMFIGGATASTAGGIKINTAMVLLAAAWAELRGREHAGLLKREIPYGLVARALAILILALAGVFTVVMLLALFENASLSSGEIRFLDLCFEAISALGTVGLSTGITDQLTSPSQYLLVIAIYLGRLGPLTLALGLAMREHRVSYRYGEERVRIG